MMTRGSGRIEAIKRWIGGAAVAQVPMLMPVPKSVITVYHPNCVCFISLTELMLLFLQFVSILATYLIFFFLRPFIPTATKREQKKKERNAKGQMMIGSSSLV